MRWMVLAAGAAVALTLWLPGEAAQPANSTGQSSAGLSPGSAATGAETISFAQYRDWRNDFVARRRSELATELKSDALAADRKARLEQTKAYYDRLAGLSEAERDRLYRDRFERIDANHDGAIDRGERAAWRDKRRALFHRADAARPAPAETPAAH